jgi:glycosyltransferase involved in cell wall biosynthesis
MCASERQRDMWIGALASNGRITAHECGDDSYRHLLDVLPFGIPDTPPKKDGAMTLLRNKVPSIQDTDTVIVSSGALWQWHDAATAVRAIARIAEHRHDIHLVLFAGTPQVTEQPKALEIEPTRALAKELNVLDRLVHFVEDWVPYSQRGQFLLECDAGVSTHSSSLESHFSYRIRILDYLWAGIPAICTDGDVLASFVARHELGAVVPPKDEAALAKKFELIADDRAFVRGCRHRIKALRPALSWHNAAEPLLRYLQSNHSHNRVESGSPSVGDLAMSAIRTVRAEGLSAAARKMHLPGWLKE